MQSGDGAIILPLKDLPYCYGFISEFTTKVITKAVTPADTAHEVAAGAHRYIRPAHQRRAGRKPGAWSKLRKAMMRRQMADEFADTKDEEQERDGSEDDYENIDISDYVQEGDDEVGDYKLRDSNYPDPDEQRTSPQRVETSFNELMLQQLGMLTLDEKQKKIAEQIVGSLDDDGYLRRDIMSIIDDLAFRQNVMTDEEEVSSVIVDIQQFDPPGVCARNLQECLLLQLERKPDPDKPVQLAIEILSNYFDEFTKKHYEKIQRALDLDDDDLREIIAIIVKLNPKPGGVASGRGKGGNYIIPGFLYCKCQWQT